MLPMPLGARVREGPVGKFFRRDAKNNFHFEKIFAKKAQTVLTASINKL
jgi:hypothetical protein